MPAITCPSPQLATLSASLPYGPKWLFELKYDGYRILAVNNGESVKLFTRNCLDWTEKFQIISKSLSKLPKGTVVDGELVALNNKGKISFASLQQSLTSGNIKGQVKFKLQYYIFDLLFYKNKDLRELPFIERRALLEKNISFNKSIILSPQYNSIKLENLMQRVEKEGLEGIMAKDPESVYFGRRSRTWLKFKINKHEEFVICGYSSHSKRQNQIGSLLLGLQSGKNQVEYCGKVGTGFSDRERIDLFHKLKALKDKSLRVSNSSDLPAKSNLCKPRLVCEVGFTEWTDDGVLRHPRFLGLRPDKKAADVKLTTSSRPKI